MVTISKFIIDQNFNLRSLLQHSKTFVSDIVNDMTPRKFCIIAAGITLITLGINSHFSGTALSTVSTYILNAINRLDTKLPFLPIVEYIDDHLLAYLVVGIFALVKTYNYINSPSKG